MKGGPNGTLSGTYSSGSDSSGTFPTFNGAKITSGSGGGGGFTPPVAIPNGTVIFTDGAETFSTTGGGTFAFTDLQVSGSFLFNNGTTAIDGNGNTYFSNGVKQSDDQGISYYGGSGNFGPGQEFLSESADILYNNGVVFVDSNMFLNYPTGAKWVDITGNLNLTGTISGGYAHLYFDQTQTYGIAITNSGSTVTITNAGLGGISLTGTGISTITGSSTITGTGNQWSASSGTVKVILPAGSGTLTLGSAAALSPGTSATNLLQITNSGSLPAISGANLTGSAGNFTSGSATAAATAISSSTATNSGSSTNAATAATATAYSGTVGLTSIQSGSSSTLTGTIVGLTITGTEIVLGTTEGNAFQTTSGTSFTFTGSTASTGTLTITGTGANTADIFSNNMNISGNLTAANITGSGPVLAGATQFIGFSGRGSFSSSGSSINLEASGANGFGALQLGGTSATFPGFYGNLATSGSSQTIPSITVSAANSGTGIANLIVTGSLGLGGATGIMNNAANYSGQVGIVDASGTYVLSGTLSALTGLSVSGTFASVTGSAVSSSGTGSDFIAVHLPTSLAAVAITATGVPIASGSVVITLNADVASTGTLIISATGSWTANK